VAGPYRLEKKLEKSTLPGLLRRPGRHLDWANLLRRVLLTEVLACACGGSRRVISSIEEGPAARRILKHLGLPAEVPSAAPARIDQGVLFPTGPPPSDACEPPPVDPFDQRLPPHLDSAWPAATSRVHRRPLAVPGKPRLLDGLGGDRRPCCGPRICRQNQLFFSYLCDSW
jgi:hypothetical protein